MVVKKVSEKVLDQRGKNSYTLMGFPVCAILRWMGKEGWSYDQAKGVLGKVGITVDVETLKSQIIGGRKGKRGVPAKLSKDQEQKIKDLLNK